MKEIRSFALILLVFFNCISCNEESDVDNDLWIGTNRTLDRNIPFPFLLERTEQKLRLIDHNNKVIDSSTKIGNHHKPMDTIKMNNHEFLVLRSSPDLLLFDLEDSVNFPYKNPTHAAQFVKAEKSRRIDFTSFQTKLLENTFQTEVQSAHFATPNRDLRVVKTMHFSENILKTTYTYFYDNNQIYAEAKEAGFQIFERKGKVFLSTNEEPDKPQVLYQVSGLDDSSFTLRSFRNNEQETERFEISNIEMNTTNIHSFDRCMEGQPGEYYHDNLTYNKGNEFLIRKIAENAPKASGDGYITVHFTLNCKGEMGNPGLEQMDREFQSTSFNPALVQHILAQVMNLKDWPEIKPGYFYKDIHSFLMFRINNGSITDLCP